ncbi:MAG: MraY family glycosyltransferase [Acidobacteriota bacterium]|nr:MraY family glycosyltransferase [Acidobacteriota bacterium]
MNGADLTSVGVSFGAAFLLSVLLVPACRWLADRTGAVAHPRNDRWHRTTIPLLGGVAIALAALLTALGTGVARELPVLMGAAFIIFVVGLTDDIIHLKPFTKLIAQIALASTLVYFDYSLYWLESRLLDNLLTIIWVVGLTNAFNLLDNMDGLCGGTALIVSVTLMYGLMTGASREFAGPEIAFLAMLAGATAGFLVYNFPPASIFMGDSGALMLGFSLAALTLSNDGVRGSRSDVLSVIAGPVFVLLIPIFDTTLVTVLRLLAGRSPAVGGRDHSSHRLVAIGLSERSAVFVLWTLAAAGGAAGLTIRGATQGFTVLVGGLFIIALCLFAVLLARVRVYDVPAAAPANDVTPIPDEFMHKKRVIEVLLDFGAIAAAYYAANQFYFDPDAYLRNAEVFYGSLPIVVALQLVAFFTVGVYRGAWHLFRLRDALPMMAGIVVAASAALAAMWVLYGPVGDLPVVMVYYAAALLSLMVLSRATLGPLTRLVS